MYKREWLNKFFGPVQVTEKIYNRFIDTGFVPESTIRLLAFKIIDKKELTTEEMAIFCGKTAEVNDMIIQISNSDI